MSNNAKWIWYPGDYEVSLFYKRMSERYERGVLITPFWRMDTHYVTVKFYSDFKLTKPNEIKIKVDGTFNIYIEGIGYIYDFDGVLRLPAGEYNMQILVNNVSQLPCIYVDGEELKSSSETFRVTCQDNEFYPAADGDFCDIDISPNSTVKKEKEIYPKTVSRIDEGILYDFDKEISARIEFDEIENASYVTCYYGESIEETLDEKYCEQIDRVEKIDGIYQTEIAKAFRYLLIKTDGEVKRISVLSEVFERENKGYFKSSDKLLEQIYDASIYTLGLCKNDFYIDGAKRDRWTWSGDAYQSFLVDYYSFCDKKTVERTIIALKGKQPIKTHINHIMDYTMYWILSLYDYLKYGGDKEFVNKIYDGAKGYVDFLLSRRNEDGFLYNMFGDWIFIDWANMNNLGETSFEQILFVETLKRFGETTEILGKGSREYYDKIANELLEKTIEVFWKDGRFVHARREGVLDEKVTKYANMFAVMFDLLDEEKTQSVIKNVLLNDEIQKITTPYMKFYEYTTLCKIKDDYDIVKEMKEYWGGMLSYGATTFWEDFNAEEKGVEKYAMYGRPYGKSLCHAWGANPIYLIFNCILGVKPAEIGYKKFVCKPKLTFMPDFECACPIGNGKLYLSYDKTQFTARVEGGEGVVYSPEGFKLKDGKPSENGYEIKDGESLIFIREV